MAQQWSTCDTSIIFHKKKTIGRREFETQCGNVFEAPKLILISKVNTGILHENQIGSNLESSMKRGDENS